MVHPGDVEFFRQYGWLKIDQLLTAEVAGRLYERIVELAPKLLKGEWVSSSAFYFTRISQRQHRAYDDPTRHDAEFLDVALSPRLVAYAKALIGTQEVRFFKAAVFEKPKESEDSLPTTPHQDYPYFPFDRSGNIQMWIALTEMSASMGTLQFVPGSHRAFGSLGRINANEEEQVALRERVGDLELTPALDLHPGDATVHHDLTIHGTGPNRTERSRWGFSVAYMRPDIRYTGAEYHATDGLGLEVNARLDHPLFPLLG